VASLVQRPATFRLGPSTRAEAPGATRY